MANFLKKTTKVLVKLCSFMLENPFMHLNLKNLQINITWEWFNIVISLSKIFLGVAVTKCSTARSEGNNFLT